MTQHRALVPASSADTAPANTVFTPRRRALFCEALSHHGNVRLACRAAGVSAQTAYRARRSCPDLAACWDAALLLARDAAEQVLADRAMNGVDEAVYYHGEEVATRRRYDSRLLLAHLARLDRLAERAEASGAAADFDGSLERLGAGERVAVDAGAADAGAGEGVRAGAQRHCGDALPHEEGEEDLPPVEAALRWLEAQGAFLHDGDDGGAGGCADDGYAEGEGRADRRAHPAGNFAP